MSSTLNEDLSAIRQTSLDKKAKRATRRESDDVESIVKEPSNLTTRLSYKNPPQPPALSVRRMSNHASPNLDYHGCEPGEHVGDIRTKPISATALGDTKTPGAPDALEALPNMPNSGPRDLSQQELEQDLLRLVPRKPAEGISLDLSDATFDDVSNLLHQAGKLEWSLRPRTFTVLWIIDAVELINDFVHAEAWDIALPYAFNSLPRCLSPSQRHHFLERQDAVLTKAAKIEEGSESAHASFGHDADNHFESLELVGRGGSGSVDRVRSKLSRKTYARKVMKRSTVFERDQRALNLFRKEIAHMRKLHHRHLVRYVGSYTDPVHVGILMEPLAEYDMRSFLGRPCPTAADFNCIRQAFGCLCAAIIYLQEQEIRHKDIKPENILVDRSRVFITDFGLARDWTEGRSTTTGIVNALTHAYAAPEVLEQRPRNSSSDIWSLGCVFLDMVTVLKGKKLSDKKEFFESTGSLDNCLSTNQEAYKGWMQELKSGYDNFPMEWVNNMIRKEPKARLTPQLLMSQITECDDERKYYGLCCDGVEDNPILVESEIDDDPDSEANGDNVEGAKKPVLDSATIERRLCNAAKMGDITSPTRWLRKVSRMLANDGRPPSSLVTRALNYAAGTGNEEVAELLIKFGCNIEGNHNDQTPLLAAACNAHEGMVQLLVKNKAKLDARATKDGCSALHYTVDQGLHVAIQSLLPNSATVNSYDRRGKTPLLVAAFKHDPTSTKILLEHGANPSLRDKAAGLTALNVAAGWGFPKVVNLLLAYRANIDTQGPPAYRTPLHSAAKSNVPLMVKHLLRRGAKVDVQQQAANRFTALHFAVRQGFSQVVEVLLQFHPNLELRGSGDHTPLLLAVACQRKNIVIQLLKAGADVNAKALKWISPLFDALYLKNLDLAQILIDHGASIEVKGRKGETLFHHVVAVNEEAMMQFMLENNANVDATDDDGRTPLMLAADRGHLVSLGLLLEHGAKLDNRDRGLGVTALHAAAANGMLEAVSLLLAFGTDPLIRRFDGAMPIHYSEYNQHDEVTALLSEAMMNAEAQNTHVAVRDFAGSQ